MPRYSQRVRREHIESVLGVMVEFTRHLLPPSDIQLADGTFTRTQLEILSLVSHSPSPPTLSAIARTLRLTQGAVTQSVDGLLDRQMVEKRPSTSDGRSKVLLLTPLARGLIDEYESAIVANVDPWFRSLSDSDLAHLARLLREVRPGRTGH